LIAQQALKKIANLHFFQTAWIAEQHTCRVVLSSFAIDPCLQSSESEVRHRHEIYAEGGGKSNELAMNIFTPTQI
jgi:hypothetical protein